MYYFCQFCCSLRCFFCYLHLSLLVRLPSARSAGLGGYLWLPHTSASAWLVVFGASLLLHRDSQLAGGKTSLLYVMVCEGRQKLQNLMRPRLQNSHSVTSTTVYCLKGDGKRVLCLRRGAACHLWPYFTYRSIIKPFH